MHKFFIPIAFAIFTYSIAQASDSAPESSTPETLKPIIQYKHFTYDPNTFKFEGEIFDEADALGASFAAYYGGKAHEIETDTLPKAQEEIRKSMASLSSEQEEKLKILKNFEGTYFEDRLKILNETDDETLKIRELYLNTHIYEDSIKKNKKMLELFSNMPNILQDVFYLVSKSSYPNSVFITYSDCDQFYEFNPSIIKNDSPSKNDKPIDKDKLTNEFDLLSKFLDKGSRKWDEREILLEAAYRTWFIRRNLIINDLLSPPLFDDPEETQLEKKFKEIIDSRLKNAALKDTLERKDKLINKYKPLADFHSRLIQVMKDFVEELKEKRQQETTQPQ